MPLEPRYIDLPLTGGQSDKDSSKTVPLGKLETTLNVEQLKTGEYKKRYGYDKTGYQTKYRLDPTEAATNVDKIFSVNTDGVDVLSAIEDGHGPQSAVYSTAQDKQLVLGGDLQTFESNTFPIGVQARNTNTKRNCDAALFGDYVVVGYIANTLVYLDTYNKDRLSGAPLRSITLSPGITFGRIIKMVATSQFVFVFFINNFNATVQYYKFAPLNGAVTGPVTAWTIGPPTIPGATQKGFDVAVNNDQLWLAVADSTAATGNIHITIYDNTGASLATIDTGVAHNGVENAVGCFTRETTAPNNDLIVIIRTAAGAVTQSIYRYNGSAISLSYGPAALVSGLAGTSILRHATGSPETKLIASAWRIWFTYSTAAGNKLTYNSYYTSPPALFMYGTIASKAFEHNGNSYCFVKNGEENQAALLLLRHKEVVAGYQGSYTTGASVTTVSRHFYRRLDLDLAIFQMPTVITLVAGQKYFAPFLVDNIDPGAGENNVTSGLELLPDTAGLPSIISQGQMFLGGPRLTLCDGNVREAGFYLHPYIDSIAAGATGGNMSDGTYSVIVCAEYFDWKGKKYRSSFSDPKSVTLAAGTSVQKIAVTMDMASYWFSADPDKRDDTYFTFYRTTNGGTIYYKESSSIAKNGAGNLVFAFDLTDDDATIINNETAYTTGGVVGNTLPPPILDMAEYGDRALAISAEDRTKLWFSKPRESGLGLEFSEFLVLNAPEQLTAVRTLDGNAILFSEKEINIFNGEGPNNLGQGSFSPIQKISTDVGCIDRRTVAQIPQGIIFKSVDGFCILTRSLEVVRIGHDIEDFNSDTVINATVMASKQQVRFLTNSGYVLVFDYHHNQWVVFDGFDDAGDATAFDGKYYYGYNGDQVSSEDVGYLRIEDDTSYLDAKQASDVDKVMDIKTGWIQLAGLPGFQRIYWFAVVGEYVADHNLIVDVYYDYDDSTPETHTLAITSSNGTPYVARVQPSRQKCNAIKIRVRDDTNNSGGAFKMTGLRMRYGQKRRVAPVNKF